MNRHLFGENLVSFHARQRDHRPLHGPHHRWCDLRFDSSRGDVPLACRLRDLIEGWIIAMQQMHIGDRWEVYIPAEMGYGKFSQPSIPGDTLAFDSLSLHHFS